MIDPLRAVVNLQQTLDVGDPETFRSDQNWEDEVFEQYIIKDGDMLYWITPNGVVRYRLTDGTEVEVC